MGPAHRWPSGAAQSKLDGAGGSNAAVGPKHGRRHDPFAVLVDVVGGHVLYVDQCHDVALAVGDDAGSNTVLVLWAVHGFVVASADVAREHGQHVVRGERIHSAGAPHGADARLDVGLVVVLVRHGVLKPPADLIPLAVDDVVRLSAVRAVERGLGCGSHRGTPCGDPGL